MVTFLFIVFFAAVFVAAYIVLDAIVPHDISVKRVGGLTFVRFGRLSGSFTIRKVA